ncbi:deacylase [candidate division KSB1 bacterium]|nr:deacylase [candidate division KSB1 bacterium]
MTPLQKVTAFLDERRVPYETLHHRRDYTAQETAADTHTPGKAFVKAVILAVDHKYNMFALPAVEHVDLQKVKVALGAREVRLAAENEIANVCADCEAGAMPPFGIFFKMPLYASAHLREDQMITFNAGTHEDVVRMLYSDYEKIAHPIVTDFTADRATA